MTDEKRPKNEMGGLAKIVAGVAGLASCFGAFYLGQRADNSSLQDASAALAAVILSATLYCIAPNREERDPYF